MTKTSKLLLMIHPGTKQQQDWLQILLAQGPLHFTLELDSLY